MARVEKNEPLETQIEQAKTEMIQTVRATGRRGRFALGCGLLFLLLVLGLAAFVAWELSATGLVRVPGFGAAYRVPAPLHAVTPGVPLETRVQADLTRLIQERAASGSLANQRVELRLPEDAFTSSLRSLLENSGVQTFDTSRVQVAIGAGDRVELFLPLAGNEQKSALIMDLSVTLRDGALDLRILEVRIGSFVLPSFLVDSLFGAFLQTNLAQLNQEIGRYATFTDLRVEKGVMIITGEFASGMIQSL